jgi:hypothetical protein
MNSITFVVLKYELVSIALLEKLFPEFNLIFWEIFMPGLPAHLEQDLWTGYGCGEF